MHPGLINGPVMPPLLVHLACTRASSASAHPADLPLPPPPHAYGIVGDPLSTMRVGPPAGPPSHTANPCTLLHPALCSPLKRVVPCGPGAHRAPPGVRRAHRRARVLPVPARVAGRPALPGPPGRGVGGPLQRHAAHAADLPVPGPHARAAGGAQALSEGHGTLTRSARTSAIACTCCRWGAATRTQRGTAAKCVHECHAHAHVHQMCSGMCDAEAERAYGTCVRTHELRKTGAQH